MQPDIVGVVQQPVPTAPPPPDRAGAGALQVLEGARHGAPIRWILAELREGASATDLRDDLIEAAGVAQVSFVARATGERLRADFEPSRVTHVMPVAMAAPGEDAEEIDRWYDEEHNRLLLRCPAWLRIRRYTVEEVDGAEWSRLALHDLSSAEVLSTPELRDAMSTPWRDRLAEHAWFLAEGRNPLELLA